SARPARGVPGQLDFARSTQPSPCRRAAQLELPRSRSAAALNVHARTPRAAASLRPRLARNLARHSARSPGVPPMLVGRSSQGVVRLDDEVDLHESAQGEAGNADAGAAG